MRRALLAGALGLAGGAALLASADAAPQEVEPERGVAVVLEPAGGRIYVRPEDVRRYRRLRTAERLPVGTTVDAQEGVVRLTVARDDDGGTWSAVFSEGKFTVTQPAEGKPVTTLKLTGPSLRDTCGEASAAGAQAPQAGPPAVGRRARELPHGRPLLGRDRARHPLADGGPLRRDAHARRARQRRGRGLHGPGADPDPTPTPAPGPEPAPTVPRPPAPTGGGQGDASDRIVPAGRSYVARPGD